MGYGFLNEKVDEFIREELNAIEKRKEYATRANIIHKRIIDYFDIRSISIMLGEELNKLWKETPLYQILNTNLELAPDFVARYDSKSNCLGSYKNIFAIGEAKSSSSEKARDNAIKDRRVYSNKLSELGILHTCFIVYGNIAELINIGTSYELYLDEKIIIYPDLDVTITTSPQEPQCPEGKIPLEVYLLQNGQGEVLRL